MFDFKKEYLYQSIADSQATIRAIDVKIGFIFVIIFLPLAAIDNVISKTVIMWNSSPYYIMAIIITAILWLLSVITIFSCVSVIKNPDRYIKGSIPTDTFFRGGIPDINVFNAFKITEFSTSQTIQELSATLPSKEGELIEQLTYEKMKISIIREIKSCKASFCLKLTLAWLTCGIALTILCSLKIGVRP